MLTLLEQRSDNLRDLQGTQAINGDNVLELFFGGLEKWNWYAVALTNIIDQYCNVEATYKHGELLVIGIVILGEVHGKNLDLNAPLPEMLILQLFGECFELCLRSRNKDEVEPLCGELRSVLLAETVGGASDDGP